MHDVAGVVTVSLIQLANGCDIEQLHRIFKFAELQSVTWFFNVTEIKLNRRISSEECVDSLNFLVGGFKLKKRVMMRDFF